ncbi:hypothetical protein BJ878DRAFT_489760 [Calycina marina]|uniref:Uncharacterized protein n=1 Tax=Calycina marina TaxID=1763456 RepID=A0A9P7ZA34_9HELO|nr:hypothetical protein BJ878DRAFT_489760 [Calycina marina]
MASPRTPRHSRHSSLAFTTPNANDRTPRRDSIASMHSPHTPKHQNFPRSESMCMDVLSIGGVPPTNGLGNLADELADAWGSDEGEDDEPDMNFQEVSQISGLSEFSEMSEHTRETTRDSGVDVSPIPKEKDAHLSTQVVLARGHRRQQPSEYDGSDYGDNSDLEDSPGIPPGLMSRMDMVESLARRGTENNGSERDTVVSRVVGNLKDLGPQSGMESGATRLITAHSALSTHLHHQTRLLQSLAYSLFSPLTLPPDEGFIDDLMPLLVALGESMPRPTTAAFTALTQLHGVTADLIQTLNYLSDTLHMSRQTTTTASRRLKSARELVAEMRKEEDAREEGERWLSRGNWSERLGNRECAGVCGDVVDGFEEVCNGWRARLMAQAESVSA